MRKSWPASRPKADQPGGAADIPESPPVPGQGSRPACAAGITPASAGRAAGNCWPGGAAAGSWRWAAFAERGWRGSGGRELAAGGSDWRKGKIWICWLLLRRCRER